MRFAIIKDGVVTNIAEADSALYQAWIDITGQDVRIGASYDGSTFTNPQRPTKPDLEGTEIAGIKYSTIPVGEFYAKLGPAKSSAIQQSAHNKAQFFVFCTDRLTDIDPNNLTHRALLKGLIQSGEVTKAELEAVIS